MLHEERKLSKMIEELTVYFLTIGADTIKSGIEIRQERAVITFQANYHPDYEGQLENLGKYLNGQKNDGMEDIYWELAGSGSAGEPDQLLLVGMMIDRAEILIEDKIVKLKLYKMLQN